VISVSFLSRIAQLPAGMKIDTTSVQCKLNEIILYVCKFQFRSWKKGVRGKVDSVHFMNAYGGKGVQLNSILT